MSTCPDGRCDGSGFLFDEAARRAYPCSCRPRRLARRRAAAVAGRLPRTFREVGFDREPLPSIERTNPHQVRAVRAYCAHIDQRLDDGQGIWFTGDVGTGKTTLAMLVSKAALEADRTVAIYSLPRLLSLLRETYSDASRYSLSDLIDRLCEVDLLHIDDVGAEQTSPWVLEQLYTIVNTRYEERKPMVLTTNLILSEETTITDPVTGEHRKERPDYPLRQQIGDRTVSRLYELCGMPLPMFGVDRRGDSLYSLPEPSDPPLADDPIAAPVRRPGRWRADASAGDDDAFWEHGGASRGIGSGYGRPPGRGLD